MRRVLTLLALMLLFAVPGNSQEIELVGPTKAKVGEYVQIAVKGIDGDQLPAAKVEYSPQESVFLIPAKTWGGEPFLLFVAREKGKYTIIVSLNAWRKDLETAIKSAESAKIDEGFVLELRVLNDEMAEEYPIAQGATVITVGDPGPDPPPPPPAGPKQLAIVFRAGQLDSLDPAQRYILTSLSARRELLEAGHVLLDGGIVERDKTGGSDQLRKFMAAAAGEPTPVLVFAPKDGGTIKVQPLPADLESLLEALK